jgi:Putative MetA-pathway of phenol degradation
MIRTVLTLFFFSAATTSSLLSQNNFFANWEARTTATQARQPSWPPPLVAPYPMLIQVFRTDISRQITPTHTDTWNYGAGRGLNLVPGHNSEIDVYYAPYMQHNAPKVKDGFGDVGFLYKYRFVSRNEKQGNFMLSAQLTATIPTGSYSNGSPDASVSPTLLSGKGWGKLDVISCLGGNLPTEETNKIGRSIAWNTTAQYHLAKYVWPELESNSTWFFAGKNDGKKQNFLTPGVVFSKFKLRPSDEHSRMGAAFGAGMQIATSQFHTYNHNLVFTARYIF